MSLAPAKDGVLIRINSKILCRTILFQQTLIRSETFKGKEPFGIWKLRVGDGYKNIDYNFPLIYSEREGDSNLQLKQTDSLQSEENKTKTMNWAKGIIMKSQISVFYPARAREAGIQGTVHVVLTFSNDGKLENAVVKKGVDINLDKEAVRVVREFAIQNPLNMDIQNASFPPIVIPIKFVLG